MTISLVSPPARLAVLLPEVRDFLKISHEDEDALIISYIRAATVACEQFTGRKLIGQQWQMLLNDWGSGEIQIALSPVLSIDKVEVWTAGVFQEIVPTDYLLDRAGFQARILPRTGYSWPDPERDVDGIRITLSAGFGPDHNAVPDDIRLGLLHWVASAYDTDGGQSVMVAERLWQSYRRVAL